MPPSSKVAPKRKPKDNQYPFDLGVRGRKTGIILPDTGIRDENGMEPMDGLFSSPAKPSPAQPKGKSQLNGFSNRTLSSEADMDATLEISPKVDGGEEYSQDLIDNAIEEDSFQMVDAGEEDYNEPEVQMDEPTQYDEESELEPEHVSAKKGKRKATEVDDTEELVAKSRRRPKKIASPVIEEEEEEDVRPVKRTRRSLNQAAELPKQKKVGSRKEVEAAEPEIEVPNKDSRPSKRGRKEKVIEEEDSAPVDKPVSKGKKAAPVAKTALPNGKRGPQKSKLESIQEDSPNIKRGPPLPRNNLGLVLLRRQTPSAGIGFQTTRSGRNSHKPIEYWRGERVEYSENEEEDENGGKVLLSRIKEIVRVDQDKAPAKKKSKGYKPKSKRRTEPESESEDDKELWEEEPGRIWGDTVEWRSQDSPGPERSPIEQEIALSNEAIVMRDVKDGHFKFAKTLSLPFFGAGIVDLPPGTEKFMKNSKQMCMVFFVHYGRVHVKIHETEFRIGKGGMWQVPRGNFYGMKNDYDKPVRLFFAQGNALIENTESSPDPGNAKAKVKGR
ncbi:putative centromere protein 3 [Amylocarpus encephaloides]|uniref:CENP-C homolog n=1 Tax=Amylocarpus encephaloides TaxID=45428 RepID=A0A9P7YCZ3_9HELO|nr:putative centromere protein 3 [Amylocarpus encephaloides]